MQNRSPFGGWKRWLPLAALVLLVGAGISRISFNVDLLKLLPASLHQVHGLSIFLKHFAQPDELLITLAAPDPATAETTADQIAERLNREPALTRRAVARPPWEQHPEQLAQLLAFLAINQSPEVVRDLAVRLAPGQAEQALRDTLERLTDSVSPQEVALLSYDPFDLAGPLAGPTLTSGAQQSEFASPDGTFRVVYVETPRHFENYNDTIVWLAAVRRALAPWQDQHGCHLAFTGEPAFLAGISASMQSDMQGSGVATLLIIALIFWGCYRRFRPLLLLQAMLLLIFVVTLGIAGLFLGQLTAIGVGSAAIMIGLSVDYGYFVYQRSQRHRGTLRELQRQCFQYIAWTAGTTAAAFFALNVSSLPGLGQLGNLVGIGVVVGAVVMLTVFAPLVLRQHQRELGKDETSSGESGEAVQGSEEVPQEQRQSENVALENTDGSYARAGPSKEANPRHADRMSTTSAGTIARGLPESPVERLLNSPRFYQIGGWATLALVLGLLGTLVVHGWPGVDFSPHPLRPRHSEADEALEQISRRLLAGQGEPLSLVVEGPDVETVRQRLQSAEAQLAAAQRHGDLTSFRTALPLWPDTAHQQTNLPVLATLATQTARLRAATLAAGFNAEAFHLTDAVLRQCAEWNGQPLPIWPDNDLSRWVLRRVVKQADGRWYALGLVQPVAGREDALDRDVSGAGIYLTGWPLLTAELRHLIPREFALAIGGIALAVVGLLALAFRDGRSLALFVGATALVFACLLGAMSLLDLRWNVFNLASLLLLLGTGTDYSILQLLALRRNGGNIPAARRELALVICLCALSASAGFGTISWANHAGLASLGQTCALGLLIDAAVSVFLLPPAWAWLHQVKKSAQDQTF